MNVLVIGLGSIGRKHVSAIKQIYPACIIYALRSSPDQSEIQGVYNLYHLDDINFKPDFIIISNPTQTHAETIAKMLNYGSPLFIEKPVLGDLSDAVRLTDTLNKEEVITYVACNMRFHPAIVFLKNFLEKDCPNIHEVNIYCGSYLPAWRPGNDFRKIYSSIPELGGGVHLDLIHEIDYTKWLFGIPDSVRSLKRNVSSLEIQAIDFAQYNFLYKDFTVNITLNYYRKEAKREIEILTDEHVIIVDLLQNTITISGNQVYKEPFDIKETYLNQIEYFTNHIKNNIQPMNSFMEGVETLKLALNE